LTWHLGRRRHRRRRLRLEPCQPSRRARRALPYDPAAKVVQLAKHRSEVTADTG